MVITTRDTDKLEDGFALVILVIFGANYLNKKEGRYPNYD